MISNLWPAARLTVEAGLHCEEALHSCGVCTMEGTWRTCVPFHMIAGDGPTRRLRFSQMYILHRVVFSWSEPLSVRVRVRVPFLPLELGAVKLIELTTNS